MNIKALIDQLLLDMKRDGVDVECDITFKVKGYRRTVSVDYKLTEALDHSKGKEAIPYLMGLIREELLTTNGIVVKKP